MKRKHGFLVLPFFVTFALFGCSSQNDVDSLSNTTKNGNPLAFEIDEKGIIRRFLGNETNSERIEVPETYSLDSHGNPISGYAYQIKGVGSYSFANNLLVKEIHLPNSLTTIGDYSFYNCPNLEKVNIGPMVESIGKDVFEKCIKLKKLCRDGGKGILLSKNDELFSFTIPSSITEIGENTLSNWSKLTSLTLGPNLLAIGSEAISYNPKLSSVRIDSANLEFIGENVFKDCPLLTSFGVANTADIYINEALKSLKHFSLPSQITEVGYGSFYHWTALQELTLPLALEEGKSIFSNNPKLQKITFGGNFTLLSLFSLGGGNSDEFYTISPSGYVYSIHKSLNEIVILDGAKGIVSSCFSHFSSINTITISKSVSYFESNAFSECLNLVFVNFKTDSDWAYVHSMYGVGSMEKTIVSRDVMNYPRQLAKLIKANSSYYWYSLKAENGLLNY